MNLSEQVGNLEKDLAFASSAIRVRDEELALAQNKIQELEQALADKKRDVAGLYLDLQNKGAHVQKLLDKIKELEEPAPDGWPRILVFALGFILSNLLWLMLR